MTIPPAFLDELRARVPLSDIVGRRIALQRAGREYKAPCPFHAEKTPSFYINDQKSFFHCFGCGAHGDAVGFLMRHDGLAFPEAVEQLAALAGMEMPKSEPEEAQKYDRLKRLADALEAACKWFEAQLRTAAGREALAYVQRRGLDDKTVAEFRLGYAPPASDALRAALVGQGHEPEVLEEVGLVRKPDDGRSPYSFFRNRVIFPVADKRGRIIAFGGRIMEGDGPKYVNSPEHALFHKGTVLYGFARARNAFAKGERPIVVEGYMDVIALQAAGIGGAVAPLGTALTEMQLAELWKAQDDKIQRDRPPILCFDGDGAGRRAAVRAVERVLPVLGPSRSVAVAFLPQGEDPDSLVRKGGAAAVQGVLDEALPLIDAVWQFATTDRALTTPEQRAGMWAEIEEQIRAIGDRQVQTLYRVDLRRRFDALFMPQRSFERQERGARPFPGRGGFKAVPVGPRPSRVRASENLETRIVLAMIVNHPDLFDELGEVLAEVTLPVAWEPLRQALFDVLAGGPLDAHALGVHLRASGHAPVLDDVLGPRTTDHARFVKADMPIEQVRAGWFDVWNRSHSRGLDRELAIAKSDPNRVEDRALERISKLGERRYYGDGAQEQDTKTAGVDHEAVVARAIADALKAPKRDAGREDKLEGDF
ncbi:MAG TPA: DNA primase [Alphaproteobacteria bacterium]|nr:DNA primase [Alphaproteobacteria bacterium]